MVLVFLFQTTQNGNSAFLVRLINHHHLESAFECLVLFEILLVFVESGGTDTTQFATGKGWFENVGSVHCATALTSAHKCVNLIDEQDDFAIRRGDFVDYGFQSLFKFALIFSTCNQSTHVQRVNLFLTKILRHIASYDTLCKTFHNGGLTRTRLTYQYRVVLGSTAQDLKHTADFVVTADNRVEFALLCAFAKVDSIFLQSVVLLFCALSSGFSALTQFVDGHLQVIFCSASVFQDFACW